MTRALAVAVLLALAAGCATPHRPTRVLPGGNPTNRVGIDASSGYVYDELLADSGLSLDAQGKIVAVTPDWARKALARTLDLQEALDNCEAERRALVR
jgi:hypothetical protein